MDLFDRHEKVVLQFSGGKDSLACLFLLRPYWERMTVVWINTGDAFPETMEQMAAVSNVVPHFHEVRSNQPRQVARNGPPADLLSPWDTPLGHQVDSGRRYAVQTPFSCCGENIWTPLDQATRTLGATAVIRGQRQEEGKKAPIKSGTVVEGVEYVFPIEKWTGQDVREYLDAIGITLPDHYAYVDSSLDCQTCTAYLDAGKLGYMRERHPKVHAVVRQRLIYIKQAVNAELKNLEACCG